MAKGDGLRAKCPFFKARVDWACWSYIQCAAMEPWMFTPVIINKYHFFSLKQHLWISGRKRRDEIYETCCCNGASCYIREHFEQGGLRNADV